MTKPDSMLPNLPHRAEWINPNCLTKGLQLVLTPKLHLALLICFFFIPFHGPVYLAVSFNPVASRLSHCPGGFTKPGFYPALPLTPAEVAPINPCIPQHHPDRAVWKHPISPFLNMASPALWVEGFLWNHHYSYLIINKFMQL